MNLLIPPSTRLNLRSLNSISICSYKTKVKNSIISELEVEDVPKYDIEPIYSDDKIGEIRNKSRLRDSDRNILLGQKPYSQSYEWYHDTVWYRKRIMGRYGIAAAECSPAIVWPTKEEIEDKKAYESVVYPTKLQDLWKEIEEKKKEEALAIRERDEEIDKVVSNFDSWRAVIAEKIKKKEMALLEAKKKKELQLQEIYEEFGQYIDPKDERFQGLLEKKEKEEKKRKKEEKKRLRAEKMMAYMAQMGGANTNAPKQEEIKIKSSEGQPISELNESESDKTKSKNENE